jgi:hypothetical protein
MAVFPRYASSLIATALNPLCNATLVNDRHSAIAPVANNNIITLTCVVMPIIAIVISYSDAYAGGTDADIRILCMCRNRNRDPGYSQ